MFNKQAFSTTFRKAKELQKHRLAAARIRIRYLAENVTMCLADGSDVALYWAIEALEEMIWLGMRARFEEQPREGRITEEMIQRAKEHPITNLISFERGKAYAFCHDDKQPSMTKHPKNNTVRCWACSRTYNPIDILMNRDSMSFADAVRTLC